MEQSVVQIKDEKPDMTSLLLKQPFEILDKIMGHLSGKSLTALKLTCKELHSHMGENFFQQKIYSERDSGTLKMLSDTTGYKNPIELYRRLHAIKEMINKDFLIDITGKKKGVQS